MLVLCRTIGESIIISEQFVATVAVIGTGHVDLGLFELNGNRIGFTSLYDHQLRPIVGGVDDIMVKRLCNDRVRLGLECAGDVSIRRMEIEETVGLLPKYNIN